MVLPSTLSGNFGKGFGGGPDITLPSRSYVPAWQGHINWFFPAWYSTKQPRCVHTLENAKSPFRGWLIIIAGVSPYITFFAFSYDKEFFSNLKGLGCAIPLEGTKNFRIGYTKEANVVKLKMRSNNFKNPRLCILTSLL